MSAQGIAATSGARAVVSRCIWILEKLRARPLRSHRVDYFMRELGVSRRTISRDLAALRDAGVRMESDADGVLYVCFDGDLASVLAESRWLVSRHLSAPTRARRRFVAARFAQHGEIVDA